jgi:hypothetical protein
VAYILEFSLIECVGHFVYFPYIYMPCFHKLKAASVSTLPLSKLCVCDLIVGMSRNIFGYYRPIKTVNFHNIKNVFNPFTVKLQVCLGVNFRCTEKLTILPLNNLEIFYESSFFVLKIELSYLLLSIHRNDILID